MISKIQNLAWRMQRSRTIRWMYLCQLVLLNLMLFVIVPQAHADDCSIDPRRAEDCLRTPGFAENLGTGVAVIGTILVNGVAIQTIILKPRDPDDKDGDNEPPKTYFLNIKTQEARTTLKPDGKDSLWVYAKVTCSDPKVDCSAMTEGITFTPYGANANWLNFTQSDSQGGFKAVQLMAANPTPNVPVPAPSASLVISAAVEGGNLTANLPLQIEAAAPAEWEILLKPDGVTEIMPDSKESLTLYARIKFDETAFPDPAQLQQVKSETKASIKMSSSTDWVKLDDPLQDTGEHMGTWVVASNPSGNPGGSQGPESCTITINGAFMGTPLPAKTVTIKLTARPELYRKPESVQMLAGSGKSEDIEVWIVNPGPNSWTFEPRITRGSSELFTFSVEQKSPCIAMVTVTEAGRKIAGGETVIRVVLTVFAKEEKSNLELEKEINLSVCQEGLVVARGGDDAGAIHVRADGKQQKTRVDLRVYLYNEEKHEIESSSAAAQSIEITLDEREKTPGYNVASACVIHSDFDGMTAENDPAAKFQWWSEKEIPGEDRLVVRYKAAVPGKDPDKFTKILPVTIEAMSLEEESAAKEVEVERTRHIIEKYMPPAQQQRCYELLERRKDTLGPKGLVALRRQIWQIAVNLILAEGAEGYKEEAAWADRIVTVLDWASWAGDIAFNAAATALCGPMGGMAAGEVKSLLISAINCYQNGQSIDEWANENVWGVVNTLVGMGTDPDFLAAHLTGTNKVKAWAVYVAFSFGRKLYAGMDIVEAAKATAQEIGMRQFNLWLAGKVQASAGGTHGAQPGKPGEEGTAGSKEQPGKPATEEGAAGSKVQPGKPATEEGTAGSKEPPGKPTTEEGAGDRPTRDEAWRQGRDGGKEAINDLRDAVRSERDNAAGEGRDPDSSSDAQKQAALRFLRDKNAMMELNSDPGKAQLRQHLNETVKGIYEEADAGTKTDVANELGVPEDDVRTLNISNPKKPGGQVKSSYDRDVTVQRRAQAGELVRDPDAPGGFREAKINEHTGKSDDWVDVPAEQTEKHYSRNFYEAATGKQGASDAECQNFTRAHDQTCTDRMSADAYGSSGKDLNNLMTKGDVKAGSGQTPIRDSQQIGQTMEYKANEWYRKADQMQATNPSEAEGCRAEGMRQTTKQYDNLIKQRVDALRDQGVQVRTDSRLEAAVNEMKKVERGEQSPYQTEQKLKQLGYDSPEQVGADSGKYFESLSKLRPKVPSLGK